MHNYAEHNAQAQNHEGHNNAMKWLLTGTALAAGTLILAPYVLPLVGIGSATQAVEAMTAVHGAAAGTGLAGMLNSAMGSIPLIGEALAEGGITTAVTSGIFGIGGVLLNRYTEKHDDGKRHIKWGKVIGNAALITSALIALPTVLTGISAGVIFLSHFAGAAVEKGSIEVMTNTLGGANAKDFVLNGSSIASVAASHLLTCGTVAMPAAISFAMNNRKTEGEKIVSHAEAAPLLTAKPDAVSTSITLEKPTSAGETVNGIVTLTNTTTGLPLTLDELKPVHTKRFHFFVIDSSLKDYHHIHPTPTEVPGQYTFSFTPKTSNSYSGWADVTLAQTGKNFRVKADMPSETRRNIPASVMMNSKASAANAGLSFEWNADKPLAKGDSSMVEITVKDSAGKPVTDLEPVLGAYAHLVGFNADGKTIIHAHPMGAEPVDENSRSSAALRFHIKPEAAGNTQFYLQVKENGHDVYAPFGQIIKQPEKVSEQVQPRSLYTAAAGTPSYQGLA